MALHALHASQTIGDSEFTRISFRQNASHQLVAVHTQDMIGSCDPQRSIAILGHAKNLIVQGVGSFNDGLKTARAPKSEALRGSHPQHTRGVLEETVHVFRGQAIARRIGNPAVFRQRAQSSGCGKPHGPVRRFQNGRHRIRRQARSGCVGGEFAVAEPAHATAECSRPNRSVASFVHRIDAVLREPIRSSVSVRAE